MAPIPLSFLAPERFASLRLALEEAGFTEPALCERLGVARLCDLADPGVPRPPEPLDSAASVLIHLFLDREAAPATRVRERLGAPLFDLLGEFGLLRVHPEDPSNLLATVMLYPIRGLYIASDRDWEPETGHGRLPRPDAVFLAMTPNTHRFLDALPASPCGAFLDLCSGTGVAGLLAAGHAEAVWACDIAARSTEFARWNALLNAIPNFHAATGDLYEPAAGRQFERIAAHPPFCPAVEDRRVFRDAGPDGERIAQAIVAGLPLALSPGGHCYLTASFAERGGLPVEQRVRAMLGGAAPEFDLYLAVRRRYTPAELLAAPNSPGGPFDDLRAGIEAAQAAGIEAFLYSTLVVQRRRSDRPVFTLRRNIASPTGPLLEWIVLWEALRREPGFADRLLGEPLSVSTRVRLNVTHAFDHGRWAPLSARLSTAFPFPAEIECPEWLDAALRLADGRRTAHEIFVALQAQAAVPADAPASEFARFAEMLISTGVVESPLLRLPEV